MGRKRLDGILNLYKPAGKTSRHAIDPIARWVRPDKCGHAGTLDPLAEGVLVVCVGKATRLISCIQEQSMVYRATFLLGQTSDTDDITGEVQINASAPVPSRADIEHVLPQFVGAIEQVPPQYSAVHVEGQRAYALARRGETADLAARTVQVDRIDLLDYVPPRLDLEIECGSGTYIRSIGRDLGQRLGCGALMSELVRTRIGPFDAGSAVCLEDLTPENLSAHLQPPLRAVEHLPRQTCTPEALQSLSQGRRIPLELPGVAAGASLALLTQEGALAAVGEVREEGTIQPTIVFIAGD
ncbi:MAG TPA: tRNA pseudouridine(55) synthase TruB [Planctomycetaceae bacterium]|nr:tRNA pseudouridine(55) synthase TruB [Planctomycetaceae bacterium]